MSAKSVSVVILNYNGHKRLGTILEKCLRSVLNTAYPNFDVLFVDNASTDDSIDFVMRNFGSDLRIRIIRNEKNLGFAEGNNRGISNSTGQYIALLNSDVTVDPNWLTEIVKFMDSPEVGAAQSKLLRMDAPEFLDCSGGLLDYYGYHFERGRGKSSSMYNQPGEIFYAKGASILLKREVLKKSGVFDPDVFLYFDEVDLCWRIHLSGYKVVYAPASIVYHASGSTASEMQSESRLYFYVRNHLMMLLKNYELSNAFRVVAASILFEARNVALSLARRKPLRGLAILKALWWNVRNLKVTWSKRQTVQTLIRRVSDSQIRRQMLRPYPPFPLYLIFPRSRIGLIN